MGPLRRLALMATVIGTALLMPLTVGAADVSSSGAWGSAEEVPGTGILNAGGMAIAGPVSCASAGNCGAGGQYFDSSRHLQVFVVNRS